ncbi:MAG TPA: ABC transporter permease subunit, partial [Thermodesulfobacteriota bacterium]|nr:ABC transporter permease subunit [Thermodesulfobacteriota bacterium]
ETIFSIPGIGQLGFESVLARDYPMIMAIATISAFLTLIGILIADLVYVLIDPRISFEGRR